MTSSSSEHKLAALRATLKMASLRLEFDGLLQMRGAALIVEDFNRAEEIEREMHDVLDRIFDAQQDGTKAAQGLAQL